MARAKTSSVESPSDKKSSPEAAREAYEAAKVASIGASQDEKPAAREVAKAAKLAFRRALAESR